MAENQRLAARWGFWQGNHVAACMQGQQQGADIDFPTHRPKAGNYRSPRNLDFVQDMAGKFGPKRRIGGITQQDRRRACRRFSRLNI